MWTRPLSRVRAPDLDLDLDLDDDRSDERESSPRCGFACRGQSSSLQARAWEVDEWRQSASRYRVTQNEDVRVSEKVKNVKTLAGSDERELECLTIATSTRERRQHGGRTQLKLGAGLSARPFPPELPQAGNEH